MAKSALEKAKGLPDWQLYAKNLVRKVYEPLFNIKNSKAYTPFINFPLVNYHLNICFLNRFPTVQYVMVMAKQK
ncbi:hypothetical protein A7K73_00525 [Candidatus Methylacidiphilum fumarolicum]|nr:hypothetical protein A7K73_00525 [Candidatus Methylacidiphilum fumarolicum]TFE77942.1 hypothetical protein A7D33_00020 [Candidatus Methylacidiphilum fumarolicum]